MVVGSYVVAALQTLVSRHADPLRAAVVTVGSFHAGSGHNIIAETAVLRGTLRTFDAGAARRLVSPPARDRGGDVPPRSAPGREFRFFPRLPGDDQ